MPKLAAKTTLSRVVPWRLGAVVGGSSPASPSALSLYPPSPFTAPAPGELNISTTASPELRSSPLSRASEPAQPGLTAAFASFSVSQNFHFKEKENPVQG